MKSLRKKVAAVVFLAGTGSLLAQPATSPSPADPQDPQGEVSTTTLTVEQMRTESEVLQQRVHEDAKVVRILQSKARKEKDVIKLNCVNDKLIQIKALQNLVDQARSQFEGSVTVGERAEQYQAIQQSASNVRQLREQAQICAGEIELTGDTASSWEAPDIVDDPAQDLFPDGIEPPAYATPFN